MNTIAAPDLQAAEADDTETVEAVIISGPRKGDLIRLTPAEFESASVAEVLEVAVEAAKEMAANATALRQQTEAFVAELRRRREARESLR